MICFLTFLFVTTNTVWKYRQVRWSFSIRWILSNQRVSSSILRYNIMLLIVFLNGSSDYPVWRWPRSDSPWPGITQRGMLAARYRAVGSPLTYLTVCRVWLLPQTPQVPELLFFRTWICDLGQNWVEFISVTFIPSGFPCFSASKILWL